MSTSTVTQPPRQERKGSFFKLIDSFACEIVTLKKEMGKKKAAEEDHLTDPLLRLGEEVGGLFYQASPCTGMGAGLVGARDSGYDSLRRRLSVLDRLVQTHSVWLQLGFSHQDATRVLQSQPDGTFVVRKSTSLQRKVLSVRMNKDCAVPVKDFPVKESQYTFSLVGSGLSFADLFRLVAFCCISRDVLPFTLKLPDAIASATTSADLEEVAKLGAGFWDAVGGHRSKDSVSSSGISAPERPPPPVCLTNSPRRPRLKTRTPSELESCQSNGALCFINPLFIKVHQPDGDHSSASATAKQDLSGESDNEDTGSDQRDSSPELLGVNSRTSSATDRGQRVPPPRPPPPRLAALLQQRSMPEKIPWINVPEKGSLFSRLSSSLSISPSSSPPKKHNISSPISIPWSRSSSRVYASPSPGHEDAQCHLALEERTIESAILRATRTPGQASSSPSESVTVTTGKQAGEHEEEAAEERGGGSQRLSDTSHSTDSSDSLDFSQPSGFFLPPLHDPSPPTEADFNTHLPLSLPPTHQPCCSTEEDEDDEEEPDYGVGLESDQDQDLTMVPPGRRMKRRPSASALVLQRALRGHLRKMSGVFNALLTPEKRAVRRVLELSRDKGSYFGCLVQDYLSYMGEGASTQAWQGYASGLEMLQTLRQFITQMKSYLRQSSELEPPIESLIPEDQIDGVLEKAMHKCVLKTLKPVVSAALQEFQVRSGEWRELKENLSLAKARRPQEMGVADALPPDPAAIEKIKHKFHTMSKLYSPEKKVTMLLRVCKLIYTIMEDNSGRLYGADDFLPMLTYVLAQCDMPELDNEILYMMELLDPSMLHGEGGYYLTSAYGAMSLIRNFQEEQAARVLSSETRDTLHQWHRRRTTQRSAPSIDDFQNYLRVALQELDTGCTAKTLQVRPYASVEEVCRLCAQKLKLVDPENYGLFLLMEGSSQQLAADTHPQKIKAELHSRSQSTPFHFVFRRVAHGNASLSAPPELMANLNDLTMTCSPQADLNDLGMELPAPPTLLNSGLSPSLGLSLPPSHLNGNSISV